MANSLCEYASKCPDFQGKESTNGIPLQLFKNVFCNRGIRGWSNCKQYLANQANETKSKHEHEENTRHK
ncbi:MAG: hypothetical protein PF517_18155 [Salinivirgaceae bacterium]|jgi:hypothetical protein|nr:hypothetical protein [Salinivirgaceae bacterium]